MSPAASPTTVSITYILADCGSIIPGKSKALDAFRSVGLISKLHNAGIATEEHHALTSPTRYAVADFTHGSIRNEALNIEVCKRVHQSVAASLSDKTSPPPFQLVIGGECCQLPSVLSALANGEVYAEKRVGLVYIDADLDLARPTDATSTGGLLPVPFFGLLDRFARSSRD